MSDELYELIAMAARYLFAGLMALIAFRALRITVKDASRAGKLRKWAPETGLSGEFVVLEGSERAKRGMRYPVIREGTIGSARACDIRIRNGSIKRRHARFVLTGAGLEIFAYGSAKITTMDGNRAKKVVVKDGDRLYIGSVLIMLILFDASLDPDAPLHASRNLQRKPAAPNAVAPQADDPLFDAQDDDDSLFSTDEEDEDLF